MTIATSTGGQASLDVADWSVAPPRFAPGLSTTHGGFTTGDLGVSPDRTHTGWLPSACRLVSHHNMNLPVVMAPNLLDAPPLVPNCPTVPSCYRALTLGAEGCLTSRETPGSNRQQRAILPGSTAER
jgi:hypothetical protein